MSIPDQIRALEELAAIDAELKILDDQLGQERSALEGLKGALKRLDDKLAVDNAAFSQLEIGGKPRPEAVLAPMNKLAGYRVVHQRLTPVSLESEGWTMRERVPGFAQVGCVKRPLSASQDGATEAAPKVVQAVYSDGLASVSLFIEPYDSSRHGGERQTSIGATQTLAHRDGDWWVTVVGDVPAATLREFAAALVRKQ